MKDITKYKGKYVEVFERNDWYELSKSTGSNELVAVLIQNRQGKYLMRYENCPPYYHKNTVNEINMVALTGMMEVGETPLQAVRREILEEVGLTKKDIPKLKYMGYVFTNKQSTLKIHLFHGWLSPNNKNENAKILTGLGDGTIGEQGSYAKWRGYQIIKRECKCGIFMQLLGKRHLIRS